MKPKICYSAIHEIKPVLILDKPIYVGFTVLDLSKWKMYDFHYDFIKKNFDAEFLFADTDSLTYEIKSENVYEEFFKWKDLSDFSNYSNDLLASLHTLLIKFLVKPKICYSAIHEIKPVLILDKPIYVGFTVLDLSKWKMYDFHYDFIKKNFDAEFLFADTDSLTYEIKSENVYEEFFKWKDLSDFSNYSNDLKFFDKTNKKVIAKMKDEFGGVIVDEFVGLKSKMYSMKKN